MLARVTTESDSIGNFQWVTVLAFLENGAIFVISWKDSRGRKHKTQNHIFISLSLRNKVRQSLERCMWEKKVWWENMNKNRQENHSYEKMSEVCVVVCNFAEAMRRKDERKADNYWGEHSNFISFSAKSSSSPVLSLWRLSFLLSSSSPDKLNTVAVKDYVCLCVFSEDEELMHKCWILYVCTLSNWTNCTKLKFWRYVVIRAQKICIVVFCSLFSLFMWALWTHMKLWCIPPGPTTSTALNGDSNNATSLCIWVKKK